MGATGILGRMMRFVGAAAICGACGLASGAAAEGAALAERAIEALMPGKILTYRNDKRFVGPESNPTRWIPRTDGSYSSVRYLFRADRSVLVQCTNFSRTGAQSACKGLAANDAGVWSVENGGLCLKWLHWGDSVPRCYQLLRESDGFRARQISGGPSSMDGAFITIR
jgi:hypothetical protein